MTSCEKYNNLIEKCVEGTIGDQQLAELKTHTDTCEPCREEFERCVLLKQIIRQAFSSSMPAEHARALLVARLAAEPNQRLQPARFNAALRTGRRAAVAAGIILAVGLFLGFALGRAGSAKPIGAPVTPQVPIRVGNLQGIVLVRHTGSDVWQALEDASNIHLGDTFHSAAKSACVLKLDDQSTLELDQNSMLVLKSYNGRIQFHLEHGKLAAALDGPHPPFFISTPHARVEALGTEFTVTVIGQ